MKVKKHKVVLIKWEDSILGYAGWKVINDEPKKRVLFYSVGFIIYENEHSITLYSDIEDSNDRQTGARDIMIPKSAIRKMIRLK